MASSCFPDISKLIELSDGTRYGYAHVNASPSKPTFLLLHGFPSASYDWRKQIYALSAKGYGVLAPDLLGYGDTDSPIEVEAYSFKRMSSHLAEILDKEGIEKVIGVGHDWGCVLLSRFYTWHASYLTSLVFVAVGYTEPSASAIDVDLVNTITAQQLGYSILGYWKLNEKEEAGKLLDSHPESATSLIYPTEPEDWKTHLGPVGAAEAWITADKRAPWPAWLTAEEAATHIDVLAQKGYTGPLNWYKASVRGNDLSLHASLSEDRKKVHIPTLLVLGEREYFPSQMQKEGAVKWVEPGELLRIESLGCGHCVQLEMAERLNGLLEGWAEGE